MIYFVVTHAYRHATLFDLTTFTVVSANKIHQNSATFPDIPHVKSVLDVAANLAISTYATFKTTHSENDETAYNNAKADLIAKLDENANEVNKVANGSKAIIELAGYIATAEKTVNITEKFEAEPGPVRGSIKLTCIKEDKEITAIWLQFPGKTPPETFDKYSFLKASSRNIAIARGYETGDVITVIGAVVKTNSDDDLIWSDPIVVVAR